MKYYLGLDIGTSNAKAVIFDHRFNPLYSSEKPIQTFFPQNGYAEQDPEEICSKATELIKESLLFAKKGNLTISSIGMSAAMHSFLPVDKNFKPLSFAYIWSDLRAIQQAKILKENKIFSNGWNVPLHPMLPLAKWQWWLDKNKEDVYKILSIKDYLIYQWTGECLTDISMASATGFFNIRKFDWDDELLTDLNLKRGNLPEIKDAVYPIKNWNDRTRHEIGIDIPPLILGATDGCLANLAAGVKNNTEASLTIGTSAALRTATTKKDDLENGLFSYPVSARYIVKGGALNNGGNVVEWLHNTFFEGTDFWPYLAEVLGNVNPGSDGLLFLPFLHGERAPFWDPELRGAYLGLSNIHNKDHFIKATLEGLCFSLKHVLLLLDRKDKIESIIVDGGFVKSDAWVQLLSDVLGRKLKLPSHSYGAAMGAAILAMMADTGEDIDQILHSLDYDFVEIYPDDEKSKEYEILFQHYLNALK